MRLLPAVLLPEKVAIMHRKAHQKGNSGIIKGRQKAGCLAQQVALKEPKLEGALTPGPRLELPAPKYTEREDQLAKQIDCSKNEQGWWITPVKQLLIPERMMETLLKRLPQETRTGADALTITAKGNFGGPKVQRVADMVVKKCTICCANNPKIGKKVIGGIAKQGRTPGE